MDWLLANPQIHSLFSSLGVTTGDTYAVSPEALPILEEINFKLTFEDQALRTFRRAIGLGQNVKSDIIPLLINAKDLNILDAGIRILVNLTMPVECLFSVDVMYRTEVGRHTIFELNKLLITTKEALTEPKTTKSIVDYMKSVLESDTKLSISQCDSINNCLLLFRNILHIPENNIITQGILCGNATTMQNTILWNLFTQSIDKLLIYMMSCSQRSYWAVTMVQLIAIMYKDQQVNTLQKLLNVWFEASLSDSSDDNESNTSPKQGSSDSSPMLTSDPTSDSSDNGNGKQQSSDDRRLAILNKETEATLQEVSRKGQEYQNTILQVSPVQQQAEFDSNEIEDQEMGPPNFLPQNSNSNASSPETGEFPRKRKDSGVSLSSQSQKTSGNSYVNKTERSYSQSEISDCGYGTQIENQESISTSRNEEYDPQQKPVHHKRPSNQKQRYNSCKKARTVATAQENKDSRRKKLVKRSKSNLINMKGLVQHIPTDEDITIILKEFVVDFLLKGYGYLVQDLRTELLSDSKFQIDTSHFFWLVTYFLRFASQLELDMEHIRLVLSFNIVSYLTFEGVNICEQFELTSRQNGGDLKPYLRRIHLVVTAIREILQTLGTYKKITHLSQDDVQHLHKLEIQIGNAEDLRNLFVLLLRNYNPTLQSKQYLQDLVVTNNILLVMLEGCDQYLETNGNNVRMTQHISQFATVEIMNHYGILLEGFRDNGEFVNNCIFTMMHHIAGDLGELTMLYQPIILKTFSQIWENDYEISDDWSDLIQLVIHKFMNTPQKTSLSIPSASLTEMTKKYNMEHTDCTWSKEEIDTLYWYYVQSKKCNDVVGKIVKFFCDNGNKQKSRISIIQQLLQQDIIDLVEYDDLMKFEDAKYQRNMTKTPTSSTNISESGNEIKDNFECKPSDDIQVLKSCIIKENKGMLLEWMQKTLLDCCYVKLAFDSGLKENCENIILESIPYHYILKQKSIPLVAWNTEQFAILSYQPFILLLHKLGFHLPADAGKLFVRMPAFWTADIMYKTAQKLGPINKALIKFDLSILISNEENCATQSIKDESTIFAIPAPKSANPIKRFTPDVESTPSVPNWLQVVMRSKCISGDRLDNQVSGTATTTNLTAGQPATSLFNQPPSTSKLHQNCTLDNEDSIMLPLDRIDEGDLQEKRQCQYEKMVAEVCENEEMSDFETASVASDLTRMYVSDEEDKADVGPHLL